jgi:hypothetical protein
MSASEPVAPRRRAKPGAVIEADELPPTLEQLRAAGLLSDREYAEHAEMEAAFRRGHRNPGDPDTLTLTHARVEPGFERRATARLGRAPRPGTNTRTRGSSRRTAGSRRTRAGPDDPDLADADGERRRPVGVSA